MARSRPQYRDWTPPPPHAGQIGDMVEAAENVYAYTTCRAICPDCGWWSRPFVTIHSAEVSLSMHRASHGIDIAADATEAG
jgi:hypothetical protein